MLAAARALDSKPWSWKHAAGLKQPTKFNLVINQSRTIPETLLAVADEVIQWASRVVSGGEGRPTA
jgi:hypothetical protein